MSDQETDGLRLKRIHKDNLPPEPGLDDREPETWVPNPDEEDVEGERS